MKYLIITVFIYLGIQATETENEVIRQDDARQILVETSYDECLEWATSDEDVNACQEMAQRLTLKPF